ncbi:MAG: hypothetical protein ACKOPM_06675 [Novosphingobium sp.]
MTARALFLAGAAALIPALAAVHTGSAFAETAASQFAPPSTTLTLTRTVFRSLSDGKQIIVTRRYAIRFSPEADGYRLDGELIDAEVDAPPALAGLAEIERKRSDIGLFPAKLDSHGLIRSTGGAVDAQIKQKTVDVAGRLIASAPLDRDAKRDSAGLVTQLANASAPSSWPRFLFNPGMGPRVDTRKVPLPDGSQGEVEVKVSAEGLMPGGMAHKVERVITTRLEGTTRVSREVWTLSN